MTTIYVFPGQGSQVRGMGKDLFEEFVELTEEASNVLGYSIKDLCLNDNGSRLGQTQYTQPALYVVNALTYFKRLKEHPQKPDFVAGHSLGEYNALLAAGAFDFRTGLSLVQKRGELMSRVSGGGMAAIIGLSPESVTIALKNSGEDSIDVANFNSYEQTVISGPREAIGKITAVLEAAGARAVMPLNVSAPFHSRYMQPVQMEFEVFLVPFRFLPIEIPVISNYLALPYWNSELKLNLARQITHSVRWVETIEYFLRKHEPAFEEIGPGMVLSKLISQIRSSAGTRSAASIGA